MCHIFKCRMIWKSFTDSELEGHWQLYYIFLLIATNHEKKDVDVQLYKFEKSQYGASTLQMLHFWSPQGNNYLMCWVI